MNHERKSIALYIIKQRSPRYPFVFKQKVRNADLHKASHNSFMSIFDTWIYL